VRYGLNKQDGIELRKTEDVLQFNSALGYRKTHSLTGTTRKIQFQYNSQMDMLTQIQKFPYLNALPLYFLRDLERNMPQRQTKILYLSPFTK
jgi:hypothetical protein